jgi:hypothetical protein
MRSVVIHPGGTAIDTAYPHCQQKAMATVTTEALGAPFILEEGRSIELQIKWDNHNRDGNSCVVSTKTDTLLLKNIEGELAS